MRQQKLGQLVQVMYNYLLGSKPLSKLIVNSEEQTALKF